MKLTKGAVAQINLAMARYIGAKKRGEGAKTEIMLPNSDSIYKITELKFHKNWSWIMQVIEEMERNKFSFNKHGNLYEVAYPDGSTIPGTYRKASSFAIKVVWQVVYEALANMVMDGTINEDFTQKKK